MRKVAVLIAATALEFTAAGAADPSASPAQRDAPRFEIAAFPGFSFGGSFTLGNTGQSIDVRSHGSVALALDAEADDASQYELFYSRQPTAMRGDAFAPMAVTLEYLQVGGMLTLDEAPRLKPYLLGGLGVTRFSPPAPGLEDTRYSLSLGLGLRVPLERRLSLRLEARGFVTLVSSNTALFCGSNQTGLVCQVHGHGSALVQGEALAGVAFAF